MTGAPEDPIPELRLDTPATGAEIARVRERLAALQAGCRRPPAPRPCCVITPLGMPHRNQIARLLAGCRVGAWHATPIADWPAAATAVYAKTLDDERLRVALAFEALWRMVAPHQPAELWVFRDPEVHGRLCAAKHLVRAAVGARWFRLILPGVRLRAPGQIARLHPIHVPDPDALALELCLLRQLAG